MRGRPDDPDLWGELYERFRRPGTPGRRPGDPRLPVDARRRLFDAAIGMLASIRIVVDVAEEVLEDRRARLEGEGNGPARWVRSPEDAVHQPASSDQEGSVVRDIPFTGS